MATCPKGRYLWKAALLLLETTRSTTKLLVVTVSRMPQQSPSQRTQVDGWVGGGSTLRYVPTRLTTCNRKIIVEYTSKAMQHEIILFI
jgi:hypothetical protein